MRPIAFAVVVSVVVGCTPQETSVGSHDAGVDAGIARPVAMFLIDKSGSLNFAMDPSDPSCPANCGTGTPCPSNCKTRMQELKAAAHTALMATGSLAWTGMAIFPTGVAVAPNPNPDACGATRTADIKNPLAPDPGDDAATMQATANTIDTEIQKLAAGGGTPTGDSLAFLSGYAPLFNPNPALKRASYVVLITDGLPNCNANNTNNCNSSACQCTLVPATSCTPASFCVQGCLDRDHSVAEITKLRNKGVRTIVIGLGAETASSAGFDSLNAMAAAGGMQRTCTTNTDCGATDSCETSTGTCTRRYYQANNAAELAAALTSMMQRL